eukprot:ANDGO_04156.mRNA.1 mitochondrial Carnitine O-acetyltransferase
MKLAKHFAEHASRLPKLPIPSAKSTVERLLSSCDPLTRFASPHIPDPKAARNAISTLASDFLNSEALPRLESLLQSRARSQPDHKSWLIDWWNNVAYLGYRDSVVNNSNFYFVLPTATDALKALPGDKRQVIRAASLMLSAWEFRHMLVHKTESFHPDMNGKDELDMQMYQYMFDSCRIPKPGMDEMHVSAEVTSTTSRGYVVVAFHGQFYTVPGALFEERRHLLVSYLESLMFATSAIASRGSNLGNQNLGVGILTVDNRDTWAENYKKLMADPASKSSVEKIQNAAFMVCLDDITSLDEVEHEKNLLFGRPSTVSNRWYDKNFQIIVERDGAAGINFDHTGMDGTVSMRLVQHMAERENHFARQLSTGHSPVATSDVLQQLIPFNRLPPVVVEKIKTAWAEHVRNNWMHLEILKVPGFGKEQIKKFKMSPDAFVQAAFHLAFFRVHGYHAPTYESAQVRRFAAGRTETIRTMTPEMADFVAAMQDSTAPSKQAELLQRAASKHAKIAQEASNGDGCDRHMLAWRLICREQGFASPELFNFSLFKYSSHWQLSTSQITNPLTSAGFGAVTKDGYGMCYAIRPEEITVRITGTEMEPTKLREAVEVSLHEMRRLGMKFV